MFTLYSHYLSTSGQNVKCTLLVNEKSYNFRSVHLSPVSVLFTNTLSPGVCMCICLPPRFCFFFNQMTTFSTHWSAPCFSAHYTLETVPYPHIQSWLSHCKAMGYWAAMDTALGKESPTGGHINDTAVNISVYTSWHINMTTAWKTLLETQLPDHSTDAFWILNMTQFSWPSRPQPLPTPVGDSTLHTTPRPASSNRSSHVPHQLRHF